MACELVERGKYSALNKKTLRYLLVTKLMSMVQTDQLELFHTTRYWQRQLKKEILNFYIQMIDIRLPPLLQIQILGKLYFDFKYCNTLNQCSY